MKKNLFDAESRPQGTVVLNWHGTPEREFSFFAEAFHRTAKQAVGKLREDPRFGRHGVPAHDFRAHPIVFLYRHALELYMKAVILAGGPMLSLQDTSRVDRERPLSTHRLDFLQRDLERVFEAFGWDWQLGLPHFKTLQDVRNVIAELQAVDACSSAFRYPIDTKGTPSLADHFQFNLFDFCEALDELLALFDGATTAAYEELQATYEAVAEGR